VVRQVFDIRHFRGFNYVECMLLKKAPRYPVMYRCEAVMGMYIFDPLGDIHVCLEAAGDPSMRIGSYDPHFQLDEGVLSRWVQRNVLSIPSCDNCKVRFLCAGGCTYECFQKSSDYSCMPFLKEMDIAWKYYAKTQPDLFVGP
jgi:radical SAM protein with 4Fe4S-binding SPASM domain